MSIPSTTLPATVRCAQAELRGGRPREHFYAMLLGLTTVDATELHDCVETGLPYSALENLREVLDLPLTALSELIRVPTRTLARRREAERLEPDESDRLLRLARVVGLALQLFDGELSDTRRWLSSPQPALGGDTPLRLAATEVGAREVEHMIGRLEHGIPL